MRRLKKLPDYAEILRRNMGKDDLAMPDFCIEIVGWLIDLKQWAFDLTHGGGGSPTSCY